MEVFKMIKKLVEIEGLHCENCAKKVEDAKATQKKLLSTMVMQLKRQMKF